MSEETITCKGCCEALMITGLRSPAVPCCWRGLNGTLREHEGAGCYVNTQIVIGILSLLVQG